MCVNHFFLLYFSLYICANKKMRPTAYTWMNMRLQHEEQQWEKQFTYEIVLTALEIASEMIANT